MVSEHTRRRLLRHAGFGEVEDPSLPSIAYCTWPGSGGASDLGEALEDVIATLATLNLELNGEVPSAGVGSGSDIPRDVAFAAADVIRQLREYAQRRSGSEEQRDAARGLWLVETAWLAVLAGDIDDLQQHLVDEERAL